MSLLARDARLEELVGLDPFLAAQHLDLRVIFTSMSAAWVGVYLPPQLHACAPAGGVLVSASADGWRAAHLVRLAIAHHLLEHHRRPITYGREGPVGISERIAQPARALALQLLPRHPVSPGEPWIARLEG